MAFTNYDFRHIPPANLIDWIGFSNFTNIFTFKFLPRHLCKSIQLDGDLDRFSKPPCKLHLGILTAVVANQKIVKFVASWGDFLASLGGASVYHNHEFFKYV